MLPEEMQQYIIEDDEVYTFNYPVEEYPARIKTLNFDNDSTVEGVLAGIKGQYLIFEDGFVLNIRKFTGYLVDFYYQ